MKKIIIVSLLSALLTAIAPAGSTGPEVLSLVRVQVTSESQAADLFSRFDETHNHSDGEIELLLWPGDLAELDSLGYDYEVIVHDLVARDAETQAASTSTSIEMPGPDRTTYRRLADYNAEMQALAKENPGLVKLIEFPNLSLEGRSIFGVEIAADVKSKDGRPTFYLDGVHHAREWPAGEYVMIYIHYLVENYGKDEEITRLLNEGRLIATPIVNVDGFDYSRESALSAEENVAHQTEPTGYLNGFEGYWRKNRRSLTGVTVPLVQKNPDAYGVDPNRNYSYLWGDNQGGSSGSQFSATYRGTAPWSEPEVVNVRDLILSRTVTGVITNHTYQATVLRAGGGNAPDDDILEPLGKRMADEMGYENTGNVGYPTTGTTDDWTYSVTGTLGFTIEHGSLGFHPPYADSVQADYKGVMRAFDIMFDAVVDPRYHSVVKGTASPGATVTLKKSFRTPLSPGNPTGEEAVAEKISIKVPVAPDGSFELHVGPSTRPHVNKAESYTLVVKSGDKTKTFKVNVARGRVADLGRVTF